jgi:hypothetical protein
MDLKELYKIETGSEAIFTNKNELSIATFHYVEWLENKVIQNEKNIVEEEEIYHSLNCQDCNLEGQYVLAKDGSSEDWSLVKLIEISKTRVNYPFYCSSQSISGHFQFVKKTTNVKKITQQEAVDLLASHGICVEIVPPVNEKES